MVYLYLSFLQCIFAFGGEDYLLLNDYKELAAHGVTPEQAILTRHFCYFGPASEGLLKRVNEEKWSRALTAASAVAERAVREDPELRFDCWGRGLGPEAQDMISGMTDPDPAARMTIDQVLAHRFCREAVDE